MFAVQRAARLHDVAEIDQQRAAAQRSGPRRAIDVVLRRDVLLLVAPAVLVVAHVVLIATRDYRPGGDWALIELRTSDVWSSRPPLTGAWSRYGWSHPGPALYAALAGPYALLGGWRGLWVGALVLNALTVATAVWLVRRHSVTMAYALTFGAIWTVAAGTPHLASDPWNASVVVLPAIAVVAALVAAWSGDKRGVAVLIVVFVLVAQTHAAYGVMYLPAAVAACWTGFRRWPRWTFGSLAAGAVLCIPIAVDAVVHWPGNLARAIRFTMEGHEPATGWPDGLRVIGRASSLSSLTSPRLPSFLSVVDTAALGTVPFVALAALVGATVIAGRRGWATWQRGCLATLLLWAGALVMTARTQGDLLIWLTAWTSALASLTWTLVAAVGAKLVFARRPASSLSRWLPRLALVIATLALATTNAWGSVGVEYPFHEQTEAVEVFAAAIERDRRTDVLDFEGDALVAGAAQSGTMAALEERGVSLRGRPDQGKQLGGQRAGPATGPRYLIRSESRSDIDGPGEVLSTWDPLTTAERDEADALTAELTGLLEENGVADRVELLETDLAPLAAINAPAPVVDAAGRFERLGELRERGVRLVLYFVDG